ncbi:MAG: hypothetical protein P8L75_03910 [Gammaproteobacteria bacterium]|jgi:hypothetical protein|nr:hypothetical protein [Gammaproteobacteria bacterium]
MKKTIIGSVIISAGLIIGAVILKQSNDHHTPHFKHDKAPMVWIDKDTDIHHFNDGEMIFKSQDNDQHIIMKKIRKSPGDEDQSLQKVERGLVIKMKSDDSEIVDKDLDQVLEDVKKELGNVLEDMNVKINVSVNTDKDSSEIQALTQDIIDSVSDAVGELSANIELEVEISKDE